MGSQCRWLNGEKQEPNLKHPSRYTTMTKLGHWTPADKCVSKFITRHSQTCWCPKLLFLVWYVGEGTTLLEGIRDEGSITDAYGANED